MPPKVRLVLRLVIICVLLLSLSPLRGQERQQTSLGMASVSAQGNARVAERTGRAKGRADTESATASEIPAEPPGHQLVRLANQERADGGIAPLKASSELMSAAQFHSDWMADHDCWSHNCPGEPTWTERILNAAYAYLVAAENIAKGHTTAGSVIDAWMGSEGHRENMLDAAFREAGGGYAASQHDHYWTLDLGSRNDNEGNPLYPVVIDNEAWSTSSLQVNLYVYGSSWPAGEMRFRNEGENWSEWEPFSPHKSWSLNIPLTAQPDQMIFLSEEGTPDTIPESHQMTVDPCGNPLKTVYAQIRQGSTILENSDQIYLENGCESWNATADKTWIHLDPDHGSGLGTVAVTLGVFPKDPQPHSGIITISSASHQQEVQVTVVVTEGPLDRTFVPQVTKDQS